MANNAPGVYIQDITSGSQNIRQASASVGVMIGVTKSGVLNTPVKITSWTEFISNFANGLDSPFLENSYLPHAVYGFFNNGGSELYVGSIKGSGAAKATKTSSTNAITATAKTEGTWGNSLKITLTKGTGWVASTNPIFDVLVELGTSDSVSFTNVVAANFVSDLMTSPKVKSWFSALSISDSTTELAEEVITLTGGSDGSALADSDYVSALSMIDFIDDALMVAIPGQTSTTVNKGVIDYCTERGLFPIIDAPVGYTVDQVNTYRRSLDAWTGALAYPWGKVNDSLSGTLKSVPAAGHLMGVYARMFDTYGIHRAPAGTEAVINGFVEVVTTLSADNIGVLNAVGVVCLCVKPNIGVVVWGARSLNSSDTTMRYVTDGVLNLTIKKSIHDGTQFAIFEANNEFLWSRLESACKAFLEDLRLSGALKGSQEEAYYVTVDDTNNTDETINNGQLFIEIGYAPVKPAEFIIIKLAHSISGIA